MKKILFSTFLLLIVVFAVRAQTVLFQDNFESYTTGGFLAQQATSGWTTWSNQPGGGEDAVISTDQAHSPTKSVYIASTADDIILKLGNKTSGKYSVKFYYFIPTGFGAYFNIQHFEAPGNEWAIEVYFGNNGTGNTSVNSIEVPFSHLMNTWIEVEAIVDLDLDDASLYIDGTLIRNWVFSMQSNAPTGTKQLGGVNFYGGAISGQTPKYYFDDVTFTQLVVGSEPPTISLSTTNIATDGTANEVFTVSNTGDQQMTFIAYPIFPESGTKAKKQSDQFVKADKANELSYLSGLLSSGLGYGGTVTVRSAVKFDYLFVKPFIGRELVSVTIGVNDLPAGVTKVQVYDRGSFSTPGAGILLAEKPFTVTTPVSEVTVTLDTPIYLDGRDIWLGWVGDATGGTYPIGMDEGPKVPGVNWTSTGPGWTEVGSTIDNNLYIMGTLQGSSIHQWLSVSPQNGVLNGGAQQSLTASFDVTGMITGNYLAKIVIGCNDQTAEYSEIDVHLTIGASVNDNNENVSVMVYPNPLRETLNLLSNTEMNTVHVYSITGTLVRTYHPKSEKFSFPVSDLPGGMYSIVITTPFENIEHKIVIK
jgi:hypothetical protein